MKYQPPFGVTDPLAAYVNGDPSIGLQGSIPPAASIEYPMREITNLITEAGLVPADSDLSQLARAVRQGVNYAEPVVVGGNPNVLTVSMPTLFLDLYRKGCMLRLLIPVTNTGPVTVNIDGLGNRSIVRGNGAALAAGDLPGSMVANLIDDGTHLQIANFQGFTSTTTNNNTYLVDIPYCADSSATSNIITANFSPAITALTAGLAILVKLANNVTAATTINVNGLGAKNVTVQPVNRAMIRGDANAGQIMWLVYDGTNFQFTGNPISMLMTNTDYYVDGNIGSDSLYDGTSGTISGPHGPFATPQHALNLIAGLSLNGFTVTLHIADWIGHAYPNFILPRLNGVGLVDIRGNLGTPANTQIYNPSGPAIMTVSNSVSGYRIGGLMLSSAGGTGAPNYWPGAGIWITNESSISVHNLQFGNCPDGYFVTWGALIQILGPTESPNGVSYIWCGGNASAFCQATLGAVFEMDRPVLIFVNAVVFSTAFMYASNLASCQTLIGSVSNPGNANGPRYNVSSNAVINTNGGGASYLPGSTPGISSSGGVYV